MATVKNVAFTTNDLAAQQADIEQRKALAAALSQQRLPESGYRSSLSPWAAALQEGAAQFEMHQARKAQTALNEKSQAALAAAIEGMRGRPEIAQPSAELGGGPGAPAVAPDPMAGLQHPATAPLAMDMVRRQQEKADREATLARILGPQGTPQAPAGVAPGTAAATGAPWAQATPQAMTSTSAGGLDPKVMALLASGDAGLQAIGKAMQSAAESHGAVHYDENGRGYTILKNGGRNYVGVGQPAPTPLDLANLGIRQGEHYFNTGQRPGMGVLPGQPPQAGATQPTPQPSPAPAPGNVPPGLTPKDQAALAKKRAEEMPQARRMVDLQVQDLDRLTALAEEIKTHPGLSRATGTLGAFPSIPGGATAQADALISSLKAQISGMKLQAMRNASATGGAVGNVTEKEWPRLENMITALDPVKMGQATFQAKLNELVGEIGKVKKTMNDAFTNEYGKPGTGRRVNFKDLP